LIASTWATSSATGWLAYLRGLLRYFESYLFGLPGAQCVAYSPWLNTSKTDLVLIQYLKGIHMELLFAPGHARAVLTAAADLK
jgi:hypothetical protein